VAWAEQRRQERLRASLRDEAWKALPATRLEVESLARLFAGQPVLRLLGSAASEQHLDDLEARGELGRYRYLHLATHGQVDDSWALRSAVILSRDALPDPLAQLQAGRPIYDGRLTAEAMLRRWHLRSELVTLSACQTALGKYEHGEDFVSFAQALLLCGTRAVCLSLWKVDDTATALLMTRFYENLLGQREGLKRPLAKAEALRDAKSWLRGLRRREVEVLAAQLGQGELRGTITALKPLVPLKPEEGPQGKEDRPYAHPFYWAAFILVGDAD
jgi:CHAT domain-containing protein